MRNTCSADELDIIIPISLDIDWVEKNEILEVIREQNERFGFKQFALAAPCGGWRSIGYPPRSFFEERAQMFREVKEELAPLGITCGWWNTLTLNTGVSYEFIRMVNEDGQPAPMSSCPLDPHFRKRFSGDIAAFAKIGKPAFIFYEDDYTIIGHSKGGCFCQYHLAEFARREGRYYSREELKTIFAQKTPESFELLRRWRELQRDSLVGLAASIRAEVDKESPEIPMGYMQSGGANADGDSTEAISRAMAGPNHTPFSRLCGTFYNGGETLSIPTMMYLPLSTKQRIKGDFFFIHESDTFPHTRFFASGAQMRAIMGTAYSFGFDGSTFQTQQLLDDPNEEKIYGKTFAASRARYNTLFREVKGCSLKGVGIPFDPFWQTAAPEGGKWMRAVSLFGIPFTSVDDSVLFPDACTIRHADDETILKMLSKGLFLDGDAAKVLCERGYSEYIGVEVGEDITLSGMLKYDLAAREVFVPPFDRFSKGKHMPSPHMFANGHNGIPRRLYVTDPAVEMITQEISFERKPVSPLMTRFENKLGGRIVVMGMTLTDNRSQSLFNYRRQRLFQELLKWCADEYVFVKDDPDVFTIMNVADKPDEKGFRCLLTLTNLCDDTLDKVCIHLPAALQDTAKVLKLDENGEWTDAQYVKTDDGIDITETLEYCDPMYLKIM